jgi:hypothetical protein
MSQRMRLRQSLVVAKNDMLAHSNQSEPIAHFIERNATALDDSVTDTFV